MSTTTMTSPDTDPSTSDAAPRGALRGPRWALLRIHRIPLWTALAFIVLAAAVTGFLRWAASAYPDENVPCPSGSGVCPNTFLGWASAQILLSEYIKNGANALLLLPLLVGAFVAGPVVARELEAGLHRLAWTQSVPPARWLASKLALAATLTVAGTLALMGILKLGGWEVLSGRTGRWADPGVYEASGPALIAYCLLGVAVGALIGLLVRRTLLAMSITGVITGTVLMVMGSLRWSLIPVRTITEPGNEQGFPGPYPPLKSFIMDSGVQNAAGDRFERHECVTHKIPGAYCPTDVQVTSWYVDFHPYAHFWYVQLIETGILLALTAAAAYAAFRVLRRRHA
ncbi:ABC transporter permease [Streptomyces spiramyceticus]|uniref:ABC transporter permease n=1 Tax=Streptomyces spiramyceticus TaxID=299717 RepID=UPI00237AF388|nr:ABC transporter permease [Streptomyces spiramyceticus]